MRSTDSAFLSLFMQVLQDFTQLLDWQRQMMQ
jgi:hypothetical protein